MREIVHLQAGQCGNQIGAKVSAERQPRLRFLQRPHTTLLSSRVFSSGRLFRTSTASTRQAPTTETRTSSWRESMSTSTRPRAESTCPEPSWWTWSPAPWTLSAPDPSDRFSVQTTSFSVGLCVHVFLQVKIELTRGGSKSCTTGTTTPHTACL